MWQFDKLVLIYWCHFSTSPSLDDTLHDPDDFVHEEETILAIEHYDHNSADQETRSQTDGDNDRRLLIVL